MYLGSQLQSEDLVRLPRGSLLKWSAHRDLSIQQVHKELVLGEVNGRLNSRPQLR